MKNHKKVSIFIVCFFILLLSAIEVYALENIELSIFLDKDVYRYGDTIRPVITISNDENTNVTFSFYEEIRHIEAKIPPYFSSPKQIIIPAKTSLNISEIYFVVTDFNPLGEYQIKAEIRKNNILLNAASKTFVISSLESLDFTIFACKDPSYTEKAKIFAKNENIYLCYESDVTGLSVSATLTKPDKIIRQISLPTSIKADQVGTYTVKAIASKQGYKTTEKTTQFGVIEREVETETTEELGFTYSNILIVLIVILVIVIILLSFKFFGRKTQV